MNHIPTPLEPPRRWAADRGFTLVELLITVVLLVIVVAAVAGVMITASRSKISTSNSIESVQAARTAVDLLADDLRSAGYGADLDSGTPQPPIAYIDSLQVLINANLEPYPDTLVARHQNPLAYDPGGSPKPAPLNGTPWQPVMKYRTGAELIRYTLDVNDDGTVDANDVAGTVAQRTRNPNDFVLMREVLGDSVNDVAGNNGPFLSAPIALVREPGGGVPPLFTVYLKGMSTPWDWSMGPVPAAQLGNIERIVLQVDAPSAKPDWRGNYTETRLTTEVSSMRNVPNFGATTFPVDGYVFDDTNKNHVRDGGESGIASVSVRLGNSFTAVSNSSGYYLIRAPAGNYTLSHTPLPQYGAFDSPATVSVALAAAFTHSFADTARQGGWVSVTAYVDQNTNGMLDAGEPGKGGARLTITPGGTSKYTDSNGFATFFAQSGGYSISCTPPDSYVVVTANPVTGSMTNGGSATALFGLSNAPTGHIKGRVFNDNNRNGVLDAGEPGITNVWVGVSADGGVSVPGFAYTDANGDYDIQVPANNPPGTLPYYVLCVVPAGKFPTSATAIGPLLLSAGQTLTGKNFGIASYQIITLNASRVLSLAAGDLIEKDWQGNATQFAVGDADLILGADAGGTDNVSAWFNQYDATPLFNPSPTTPAGSGYTRNAPNSVLALALDTLDTAPDIHRPDVVTGCKTSASGNFFLWLNQNTSGNEGYLPLSYTTAYRTNDNGDVQAVKTLDCAGGPMPDLIVGTKSPTAGNGTFEVWQSNDAASPVYTRQEIYPPAGSIPGGRMGEVTSMALGDLDNNGTKDLVVGTRTGSASGELLVFRNVSRLNGLRFTCDNVYTQPTAAVTALTCIDVNGDGVQDVIAGTQTGTASGTVQYWRNKNTVGRIDFALDREVAAPGIVMSVVKGDLGGGARLDVAVGWRQDETSYVGGVLIYYMDAGTLPATGVDPSGGSVINMVPALTTSNFNFGLRPSVPPPPYLTDLAAGLKSSPTTGALVVFIR
jgi:prepilin-type N-terminal cleavage/methylation domain-containing protein